MTWMGRAQAGRTLYIVGSSLLYLFVRGLTCMAGPALAVHKVILGGAADPTTQGAKST